jgi:hypothetical protein
MTRYIRLDDKKMVVSVRYGDAIVQGEIESELGDAYETMQDDGTFSKATVPKPTMSDSQAKLNYIYLKIKGLI